MNHQKPFGEEQDIANLIIDLIHEYLSIPREKVEMDSHFIDDLGTDEIVRERLFNYVFAEFDLQVEKQALEKIEVVGELYRWIVFHIDKEQNKNG